MHGECSLPVLKEINLKQGKVWVLPLSQEITTVQERPGGGTESYLEFMMYGRHKDPQGQGSHPGERVST